MVSVHALYKITPASTTPKSHTTTVHHVGVPTTWSAHYDLRSIISAGLPRTFSALPLQSRPNVNPVGAPASNFYYGTFTLPSSVGAILTPARVVKILTDGCSDIPSGGA